MNPLTSLFPLCALSFSLFLTTAIAATPLYTVCSPNAAGNFSACDPYAGNLRKVTTSLTSKVKPTGFAVASSGKYASAAYGLALCRGDVSSEACETCVADAAVQLRQACPNQKDAIIWFDNCLLRYANFKFFGTIYNGVMVYMWNIKVVSNPTTFNKEVVELLNTVTAKAYSAPLLFGTGEMEGGTNGKLYALAQCTRDLSPSQCKTCLDRAVSEFPNCCDGKKGGRVLDGSCNFRYELYPFYGVD